MYGTKGRQATGPAKPELSDTEKFTEFFESPQSLLQYRQLFADKGFSTHSALRKLSRAKLEELGVRLGHQAVMLEKLDKSTKLPVHKRLQQAISSTDPAFRRVTIRTQIYEGAPTRDQTVTALFYGATVVVALAGGLYVWKSDNARTAALADAEWQAIDRREVAALSSKVQFTFDQLAEIQRYFSRKAPNGRVNLNDAARSLTEIAAHFGALRTPPSSSTSPSPSESTTSSSTELCPEDFDCLFRRCALDAAGGVSITEVLAVLSLLMKSDESGGGGSAVSRDRLRVLWDLSNPSKEDDTLGALVVASLFTRIIRLRLADPASLVCRTGYFPPTFDARAGLDVLELMLLEIKATRTSTQSQSADNSSPESKDASKHSESSSVDGEGVSSASVKAPETASGDPQDEAEAASDGVVIEDAESESPPRVSTWQSIQRFFSGSAKPDKRSPYPDDDITFDEFCSVLEKWSTEGRWRTGKLAAPLNFISPPRQGLRLYTPKDGLP